MHNLASVQENEAHKLQWDFNIRTDHLISVRRSDLIIIDKKTERKELAKLWTVLVDHRVKLKESEKKDSYLDLARELKKLWNLKVIIIPYVIGDFGTITKRLVKGLEDMKIRGRVGRSNQLH